MNKIIEDLNWRFACKAFNKDKKLSDEDINSIKEIIKLTPTSYGLQPFRVLIVENMETREQLKAVSFNQSQVTEASHFLVFVANKDITTRIEKYKGMLIANGSTEESAKNITNTMLGALDGLDERGIYAWASMQSYIALGNIMTSLSEMRIDSCPMEGFSKDDYNKILGLDVNKESVSVALAIGYRDREPSYKKLRFDDLFEII